VPEHDTFYVIQLAGPERDSVLLTVVHDVPAEARELGSFADPGAAIDFAQEEVRRLNTLGVAADYVDPSEDLVGTG
jgi:hypothetical protein